MLKRKFEHEATDQKFVLQSKLIDACNNYDLDGVLDLINQGVDLTKAINNRGLRPITIALRNFNKSKISYDIIKALLNNGAEINHDKKIILHATMTGSISIVKLILLHMKTPSIPQNLCESCIIESVNAKNYRMLDFILEQNDHQIKEFIINNDKALFKSITYCELSKNQPSNAENHLQVIKSLTKHCSKIPQNKGYITNPDIISIINAANIADLILEGKDFSQSPSCYIEDLYIVPERVKNYLLFKKQTHYVKFVKDNYQPGNADDFFAQVIKEITILNFSYNNAINAFNNNHVEITKDNPSEIIGDNLNTNDNI